MKKIAFVIQRYGIEVAGGAELLCRQVAEHVAKYFDIEILTTCAIDYLTWKNEYKEGYQLVNNIPVIRFKTDFRRKVRRFGSFADKLYSRKHTFFDEVEWIKRQGPHCTGLIEYIKENEDKYDLFVFFTYLYFTTLLGLPIVSHKSVLLPTAHDEPPIYLDVFRSIFRLPRGFIFNTYEEMEFVQKKFKNEYLPGEVIGIGVDIPSKADSRRFRDKFGITDDFILYMGRIDVFKGCRELFDYFLQFKKKDSSGLKLVLFGKEAMKIPSHKDIISLGFLDEQDKLDGIASAALLIAPSKYESLSIVILEAWAQGIPVAVNRDCAILEGHCSRSGGGFCYSGYNEFEEVLQCVIMKDKKLEEMERMGKKYVEENFRWELIEQKYKNFLEKFV